MRIGPRDRSRILTLITVCAILLVASFLCWPLIPRSEPKSPFGIVESITVEDPLAARPDPRFTPRQVVDIQLRALEHARENDEGFATCFAFASPDNKRSTGPVDRFKQMIGSPPIRRDAWVLFSGGRTRRRPATRCLGVRVPDRRGERSPRFCLQSFSKNRRTTGWMPDDRCGPIAGATPAIVRSAPAADPGVRPGVRRSKTPKVN